MTSTACKSLGLHNVSSTDVVSTTLIHPFCLHQSGHTWLTPCHVWQGEFSSLHRFISEDLESRKTLSSVYVVTCMSLALAKVRSGGFFLGVTKLMSPAAQVSCDWLQSSACGQSKRCRWMETLGNEINLDHQHGSVI